MTMSPLVTAPASQGAVARSGRLPLPAPLAYASAAIAGVLYWLAFPGSEADIWPLAFIAWVPLIVAMHRQPAGRAMRLGWLTGLTMNVLGFSWLQHMLSTFSGFPAPVCFFFLLVVCGYQGGRVGLLGWLHGRATGRGWPTAPVFAAAFAASELLYPLLFPWYFATTVHKVPLLTQLGDVGGPILVGLALVSVNLAVAEPALAWMERRAVCVRPVATGAVVIALTCGYGAARIRAVDAAVRAAPESTVGVVQADMGLLEKRTAFGEGMRRHLKLSDELHARGVDFLVWSETSATRPVRDATYSTELRPLARRIGLPAIFGVVIIKPVDD
ncbi:MAG: apolipoprotein N-acyltransferase, partial [Polyangiaceae bacterium]